MVWFLSKKLLARPKADGEMPFDQFEVTIVCLLAKQKSKQGHATVIGGPETASV